MNSHLYHLETKAIHGGAAADGATGALEVPIHQATAFAFRDAAHAADLFSLRDNGYVYSRLTNPTVAALQEKLALMEGGVGATCAASGHAAIFTTFFNLLQAGDAFVASTCLYGGCISQLGNSYQQFDWQCHFAEPSDPDNFKRALTENCKAIFLEGVANPGGIVVDIEAVARIAHDAGIPLIVDNTLATPYLCKPFDYGADLVVYSTTKFLCGHGNAIGGAVIDSGRFDWSASGKFPLLTAPDRAYHGLQFHKEFGEMAFTMRAHALGLRDMGACMAPMTAYLTHIGMETLPLRMQRHVENAQAVAEWLEQHPKVAWVSYAGLPSSEYHTNAQKYCPKGAGALFTFGVEGGAEAAQNFVSSLSLCSHVANLGDTRTLVVHPYSTTHAQLNEEQKVGAGVKPELVRMSVGIEHIDDIIQDIETGLDAL